MEMSRDTINPTYNDTSEEGQRQLAAGMLKQVAQDLRRFPGGCNGRCRQPRLAVSARCSLMKLLGAPRSRAAAIGLHE